MTEVLDRPLALALQGGGSHGALTWGVLDRLLEAGMRQAGLSGTSAGALNAAALASGWAVDGARGARSALQALWSGIGGMNPSVRPSWSADGSLHSATLKTMTRVASPYQFNPAGFNPLRQLLATVIDWEALRAPRQPPLCVAATEVATGRLRLFQRHELNVEMLLASSCIPTLFRAVEIDGKAYWDGGFAANPALLSLVMNAESSDLMLIQLLPERAETMAPRQVDGILNRSRELGFSTHLLRELHWLATLQADGGPLTRWSPSRLRRRVARLRFHHLDGGGELASHGEPSPLDTASPSLEALHRAGREAGQRWLRDHGHCVGRFSSRPLSAFAGLDG